MSEDDDTVPEAEGTDTKEVYAFFGLAAYMGQVVEKALVMLLALLETDGLRITRAEFDSIFSGIDSRTFGQLLKRIGQRLALPPATEALLSKALERRNFLVHQFFADRAPAFVVEIGRAQMIEELRDLTLLFQRADRELVVLCAPLRQKRGMTQEGIDREIKELVDAFVAGAGGSQ